MFLSPWNFFWMANSEYPGQRNSSEEPSDQDIHCFQRTSIINGILLYYISSLYGHTRIVLTAKLKETLVENKKCKLKLSRPLPPVLDFGLPKARSSAWLWARPASRPGGAGMGDPRRNRTFPWKNIILHLFCPFLDLLDPQNVTSSKFHAGYH